MKKKILVLKVGNRLRNKRYKTIYEIKNVDDNSVALVREDGLEYILVPVDSITSAEYEPVYD